MIAEAFRKRECGDCNFCCIAPAIEEIESPLTEAKPATDPCQYCDGSSGCRVYNARPEVCREYLCTYAIGETEHRPDDCGVAWSIQEIPEAPGQWMLTGHALDSEAVLADSRNWEPIGRFLALGAAHVVVRDDKIAYGFSQSGDVIQSRECLLDPNDPMKVKLLPETEKPSRFRAVSIKIPNENETSD